jgi:hypothetical protein
MIKRESEAMDTIVVRKNILRNARELADPSQADKEVDLKVVRPKFSTNKLDQ